MTHPPATVRTWMNAHVRVLNSTYEDFDVVPAARATFPMVVARDHHRCADCNGLEADRTPEEAGMPRCPAPRPLVPRPERELRLRRGVR